MKPSPQPQLTTTQTPLIPYRTEPPSNRFSHSYRACNQGVIDSAKTVQVHPDSDGFYNHAIFSQSEPNLEVKNRAGGRSRREMDPNFLMPPERVFGRHEPDLYALGYRVNPTHHSKTREGSGSTRGAATPKSQAQHDKLLPMIASSKSQSTKSKHSTSKVANKSSIPSSTKSSTTPNQEPSSYSSLSEKNQPRDLRYLYDWSNHPSGPPPPIYADHITAVPVDKIPYRTEPPNARMSRSFWREERRRLVTLTKETSDDKENMKDRQSVQVLPKAPGIGEIRRKSVRIAETPEVAESPNKHGEKVKSVAGPKRTSLKEVAPVKVPRAPTTYSPSTSSSRTAVELDADRQTANNSVKTSATTVTIVVPSSRKPIANAGSVPVATSTASKPATKPDLDAVVERGRTLHRSLRRSRSAPLRSPRSSSSSSEDNDLYPADGSPIPRRPRALSRRKPRPRPLDLRTAFKVQELITTQAPTEARSQGHGQKAASLRVAPNPAHNPDAIPVPTVIAVGPLSVHFADAPEIISFYTCSSSDEDGMGNVSDSDTLDDAHDAGSVQDVDAIMALGLPGRTKDGDTPHPAKERFSLQSIGSGFDVSSHRKSDMGGLPTTQADPEFAYPFVHRPPSTLSATVSTGGGEPGYTVIKTGPNGEVPKGFDKLNLLVRRWLEKEKRHSHFVFARSCEMKYDVAARQIYYETTFDDVLEGGKGGMRKENFYPFKGEVEWRVYH